MHMGAAPPSPLFAPGAGVGNFTKHHQFVAAGNSHLAAGRGDQRIATVDRKRRQAMLAWQVKLGQRAVMQAHGRKKNNSRGPQALDPPTNAVHLSNYDLEIGVLALASGRWTVKVVPSPSTLSTLIVPPWRAMISFTTYKPTPIPLIRFSWALGARKNR